MYKGLKGCGSNLHKQDTTDYWYYFSKQFAKSLWPVNLVIVWLARKCTVTE